MSLMTFLMLSGAIVMIVFLVFTVVFYALRAAQGAGKNSDENKPWHNERLTHPHDHSHVRPLP